MPEFKRGGRWQDLDIMNWILVEQFQEPLQTDEYDEQILYYEQNYREFYHKIVDTFDDAWRYVQ